MRTGLVREAVRGWAVRSVAALSVMACVLSGSHPGVRAEFKPGTELPEFTLRAADGTPFALQRKRGQVVIKEGTKEREPKLLVLHLFQPDCLQCQAEMKALEKVHQGFGPKGVLVVGVAHRGAAEAARAMTARLKVTFPVAVGTGSALAKQFAAGDALAIADDRGVVRFAQVGYGAGDEKVWREGLERLLAGRPVAQQTVARRRLRAGDRLPLIELPSVTTGRTMSLTGAAGRLTFREEGGQVPSPPGAHPRAAVGFFSRY
jgi:peroxiredoxin